LKQIDSCLRLHVLLYQYSNINTTETSPTPILPTASQHKRIPIAVHTE